MSRSLLFIHTSCRQMNSNTTNTSCHTCTHLNALAHCCCCGCWHFSSNCKHTCIVCVCVCYACTQLIPSHRVVCKMKVFFSFRSALRRNNASSYLIEISRRKEKHQQNKLTTIITTHRNNSVELNLFTYNQCLHRGIGRDYEIYVVSVSFTYVRVVRRFESERGLV